MADAHHAAARDITMLYESCQGFHKGIFSNRDARRSNWPCPCWSTRCRRVRRTWRGSRCRWHRRPGGLSRERLAANTRHYPKYTAPAVACPDHISTAWSLYPSWLAQPPAAARRDTIACGYDCKRLLPYFWSRSNIVHNYDCYVFQRRFGR